MERVKSILFESLPCWYELIWRNGLGMVLRIHSDFVDSVHSIKQDAPVVLHFMGNKGFSFKAAKFVFGNDMGFDEVLPFVGRQDDFLEYRVRTPLCRKYTNQKCMHCEGTGKDTTRSGKCFSCRGSRKEVRYDFKEAYAISASLNVLFILMRFSEVQTRCHLPQLMTLGLRTERGRHGGSLSGEFSPDLLKYLSLSSSQSDTTQLVSVMKETWDKMEGGLEEYYKNQFRVYLQEECRLIVDCPGDACNLFVDPETLLGGCKFGCHNTDNMLQQLTFLSALAKLQTLAREAAGK